MKRTWNISYRDRLWICFVAGVAGGTMIANLLSGELQSQIGYFDLLYLESRQLGAGERQRMWLYVVRQRMFEVAGAWLLGLTVCSAGVYYLLAVLAGGSMAVALSVLTMQKGITALLWYLASVFPHAVCYVPVYLVLAAWAGEKPGKPRLGAAGILGLLTMAGTVLEVYINPLLMEFFQKL